MLWFSFAFGAFVRLNCLFFVSQFAIFTLFWMDNTDQRMWHTQISRGDLQISTNKSLSKRKTGRDKRGQDSHFQQTHHKIDIIIRRHGYSDLQFQIENRLMAPHVLCTVVCDGATATAISSKTIGKLLVHTMDDDVMIAVRWCWSRVHSKHRFEYRFSALCDTLFFASMDAGPFYN